MEQNNQQQMVVPARIVPVEERQRNIDNYDKYYLILMVFNDLDGNGEYRDWIKKKGRREAYDYIRDMVINEPTFDVVATKLLSNGNELGDEVNGAKFLRFMKDKFFKDDMEFDIDDYIDRDEYWSDEYDIIPEE